MVKKQIASAIKMLLALTLLTGVVYPLIMTGICRIAYPDKSDGSIVRVQNGMPVGSRLLAQEFDSTIYFHPRPSAVGYNAPMSAGSNLPASSGGSNWGPIADTLRTIINSNRAGFIHDNGLDPSSPVPNDIVTSSGSGLDPDISPDAARIQINRVASARHFAPSQTEQLKALVESKVQAPQFGILGDSRVNVLDLNLALDAMK